MGVGMVGTGPAVAITGRRGEQPLHVNLGERNQNTARRACRGMSDLNDNSATHRVSSITPGGRIEMVVGSGLPVGAGQFFLSRSRKNFVQGKIQEESTVQFQRARAGAVSAQFIGL